MAKINLADSGKFATQSANEFFTLAEDGDIARVRFLYQEEDGSDVDYFLVHEVEVEGKKRYAACLALDDNGSLHPENCPLCKSGSKRIEKLFLQVYDEETDVVKTWDRGKMFVPKITTYIKRYGSLVAQPIEIERKGKKGDTNTTYEMFPLERDGKTLEDFPEKQNLLGSFILDLTPEECEDVLDGVYRLPNSEGDNSSSQTTRRASTGERGRRTTSRTSEPAQTAPADDAPRRTRTRSRNGGSDQF